MTQRDRRNISVVAVLTMVVFICNRALGAEATFVTYRQQFGAGQVILSWNEKAARGGASGRRFPWTDSDTITHSLANHYGTIDFFYDVSPTQGSHPSFALDKTSGRHELPASFALGMAFY